MCLFQHICYVPNRPHVDAMVSDSIVPFAIAHIVVSYLGVLSANTEVRLTPLCACIVLFALSAHISVLMPYLVLQLKSIVYIHAFLMFGYAVTAIVWGIMEIAEGGKTDPMANGVRGHIFCCALYF